MKNQFRGDDSLVCRLKHRIDDLFHLGMADPDRISENEPLIGGKLGLDSLDALELAMCLEEEFGVALAGREEMHAAYSSIASLAECISARARKNSAPASTVRMQRPMTQAKSAG